MESQPALLGCHVYFCNYRSIGRIFLWLPRHVTSYQCVHAMQGRAGRDALIFLVPCDRLTQMRTRKMLSCGETVEQLWLCRMTRMRTSQNQCTHWKMASRQSLLWLLCAWSPVFYIFCHRAIRLSHPFRNWKRSRHIWWLPEGPRALVEFYAPLPEVQLKISAELPITSQINGQGHGVDIARNWSQNTTRQQMLFEPMLAERDQHFFSRASV